MSDNKEYEYGSGEEDWEDEGSTTLRTTTTTNTTTTAAVVAPNEPQQSDGEQPATTSNAAAAQALSADELYEDDHHHDEEAHDGPEEGYDDEFEIEKEADSPTAVQPPTTIPPTSTADASHHTAPSTAAPVKQDDDSPAPPAPSAHDGTAAIPAATSQTTVPPQIVPATTSSAAVEGGVPQGTSILSSEEEEFSLADDSTQGRQSASMPSRLGSMSTNKESTPRVTSQSQQPDVSMNVATSIPQPPPPQEGDTVIADVLSGSSATTASPLSPDGTLVHNNSNNAEPTTTTSTDSNDGVAATPPEQQSELVSEQQPPQQQQTAVPDQEQQISQPQEVEQLADREPNDATHTTSQVVCEDAEQQQPTNAAVLTPTPSADPQSAAADADASMVVPSDNVERQTTNDTVTSPQQPAPEGDDRQTAEAGAETTEPSAEQQATELEASGDTRPPLPELRDMACSLPMPESSMRSKLGGSSSRDAGESSVVVQTPLVSRTKANSTSSSTHGGGGAKLSLELQVGTWREWWPKDITTVINVDKGLVVRHYRHLKKLDLVRISVKKSHSVDVQDGRQSSAEHRTLNPPEPTSSEPTLMYESVICDSTWISSLPNISTLHHFEMDTAARGRSPVGGTTSPTNEGQSISPVAPGATTPVSNTNCVLCIADDYKRCIVFSLANDAFEQLNATSLPIRATHVVPFAYRGVRYFLAYYAVSGEYGILPFRSVATGTPVLVAKGSFRSGWTDVVWKGTHHVRCTRQKFFCYNNVTGESAFECVWVRGASTSSSVCSAEHITMMRSPGSPNHRKLKRGSASSSPNGASSPTKNGSPKHEDEELQVALHRKSCIVVPMFIGGRFAAMMYSHASYDEDANGQRAIALRKQQSTGRLLDGSFGGNSTTTAMDRVQSATTMYNVTEAASLLLRKRVFAHNEPWSHFCILTDFGESVSSNQSNSGGGAPAGASASGDNSGASMSCINNGMSTMLCYSAVSGEVWINTLYFTEPDNVAKEVTIFESAVPAVIPTPPIRRPSANTGLRHHNGRAGASGGEGHTIRHFLAEQAGRRSPFDHPVAVDDFSHNNNGDHKSRMLDDPTSTTPQPRIRPQPGSARPGSSALSYGTAGGQVHSDSGTSREYPRIPIVGNRPSSSSLTLNRRLNALPGTTGDYHTDITNAIHLISSTDFAEDSPYVKLALSRVSTLPTSDARLVSAGLGSSRSGNDSYISHGTGGGSAAAAADLDGRVSPRYVLSPGRAPWKPSSAPDMFIPAPPQSPSARFLASYEKHVSELPAKVENEAKLTARLYSASLDRRNHFQQHELDKLYQEMHKKQVGGADRVSPVQVGKTVEKLAVSDVDLRRKKNLDRHNAREMPVVPQLHAKTPKLDAAETQSLTERMHYQEIAHRKSQQQTLKAKLQSTSPMNKVASRSLSPQNLKGMVKRLGQDSVAHQKQSIQHIERAMDDDFYRRAQENYDPSHKLPQRSRSPKSLTPAQIEVLSEKLYQGKR